MLSITEKNNQIHNSHHWENLVLARAYGKKSLTILPKELLDNISKGNFCDNLENNNDNIYTRRHWGFFIKECSADMDDYPVYAKCSLTEDKEDDTLPFYLKIVDPLLSLNSYKTNSIDVPVKRLEIGDKTYLLIDKPNKIKNRKIKISI